MSLKTCAANKCTERFEPFSIEQIYCSHRCAVRMAVRAHRARKRFGGGDPDGGGRRQRTLFPKPALVKSKPPKPTPVPQPVLFETDLLATHGGAVEYGENGSVSDKNRDSVTSGIRKPSESAPALERPEAA
jgi:CGNR zinc finger